MSKLLKFASFAVIVGSVSSPAFAGDPVIAAPGPMVGVGIPALIALGYAYKKIRDHRSQ